MNTVEQAAETALSRWVSRRRRRARRWLPSAVATIVVFLALVVQPSVAGAMLLGSNLTRQVGIIPFTGDVFTISSAGNLIPVSLSSTPASAPLFNLAGDPLNLTFGQWTSATATSYAWTFTFRGTAYTRFLIGMRGLVPNGVYSLFYRTFGPDSNNAFCPNVEPQVALTAAFPRLQRPDSSSFRADRSGRALFFASVAQNLLAAQQLQEDVIYHFNGQTYGPVANQAESGGPVASEGGLCRSSYGIDAMRQLLIIQK
jgi:hypothetical protein